MKTIETLDSSPFKHLVMTIGSLPTSFVDSMSYYEALAWLVSYLEKTVIPAVNNNAAATEELQKAVVELKEYVDHYFDNLDVQTEINNKLDAMVLDGTLAEVINEQIFEELDTKVDGVIAREGDDIKYHFIKTDSNAGDCTLVQIGTKNILIDLSASETEATLMSYLSSLEVTHLDALIISHFHYDHIGGHNAEGFGILCNAGIIDDDTAVYVPKEPNWNLFVNDIASDVSNVVGRVTGMIADFEAIANAHNITITHCETGDEINVENTKIKFLNCDDAQYINYYDVTLSYDDGGTVRYYTDYNNFSMIALVGGKCSALFTGDIAPKAEEINDGVINMPISILKVPHHGVNNDCYSPFLYKAIGSVNVIMNTASLANPRRPYVAASLALGKRVYSSEWNNTVVIEDKFGVLIDDNEQASFLNQVSAAIGFDFLGINGVNNLGLVQYDHDISHGSTDLNDYKTAGVYLCPTAAVAGSLSHMPTLYSSTPFKLTVMECQSEERILQELHTISPYNEVYYRWYGGSDLGWSPWTKQGGDFACFNMTAGVTESGAAIAMSKSYGTDVISYDSGVKIGLPGVYEIGGQLTITNFTDGVVADVEVLKNGTRVQRCYASGTGDSITIPLPSIMLAFTTNDVLTVKVITTGNVDYTLNANSNFLIKKMQ